MVAENTNVIGEINSLLLSDQVGYGEYFPLDP